MKTEQMDKTVHVLDRSCINLTDRWVMGSFFLLIAILTLSLGLLKPPTYLEEVIILIGVMLVTVAFHEYLHVLCFKLFGNKKANIKILRDKELGTLVVYQQNKEVIYNKRQTFITLLTPCVLITCMSLPFLTHPVLGWIVGWNMILNLVGSVVDCGLVLKIQREYKLVQTVRYDYVKGLGVQMIWESQS